MTHRGAKGRFGGTRWMTLVVLALSCREPERRVLESGGEPIGAPSAAPNVSEVFGLASPANDAPLVALAQRALACRAPDASFGEGCEGRRAWQEERTLFESKRAESTLLRMVGDRDVHVRMLALEKLALFGQSYRGDSKAMELLVRSAEKESHPGAAEAIGVVLGRAQLSRSGAFEALRLLATRHPQSSLRASLIEGLLPHNPEHRAAFELAISLLGDSAPAVRMGAVMALWGGGRRFARDTCAAWAALITVDAGDETLLPMVHKNLAWWGGCEDRTDLLVRSLRVRMMRSTDSKYSEALGFVCMAETLRAEQRNEAKDLLEKVATTQGVSRAQRVASLQALFRCDRELALRTAKLLRKDPDPVMVEVSDSLGVRKADGR